MFEAKKAVDFQRVLAKIAKWKCIFTSITFTTNSYLFAKFLKVKNLKLESSASQNQSWNKQFDVHELFSFL